MALNSVLMMGFFQSVWELILAWDKYFFIQINQVLTLPFFDHLFPIWREANTWMPLYLFLMLFAVMNFPKKAFSWIVAAIITFALSDQMSSSVIKPLFGRLRPCNDPEMFGITRLLLPSCGSGYSFISSHATNHFAFACFIYLTLGHILGKWKYAFLVWAASIAYAQVYVGVHYPIDVICGALVGTAIGYTTAKLYQLRVGQIIPEYLNKPK